MATIANEPMYPGEGEEVSRSSVLENLLSRGLVLNWERALIITILVVAIFTRFYNLGERAMSHDESLHVYYSYELYTEGKFVHTPLMHGPIIFHATAFFYSIFGDSDFTARIYAALLGVFMVMSPLLFRRWLGRWGALLACVMILISPLLMFYNRYIREDTPAIMASILMTWAILMYLKRGRENQRRKAHWLYILAAALLWNLASKETAFMYVAIMGTFLLVYWFARLMQYFFNQPGRVWFNFASISVLLAGLTALGMYIILDITPLERIREVAAQSGWFGELEPRSFVIWTLLVAGFVTLLVAGTMFYAFRNRFSRLPLRELALIVGMVVVVLVGLILLEEVSHVQKNADDVQINQPVPGEEQASTVATTAFTRTPLIAAWALMFITLGGLWYSRRANWWEHLDQFAELDVMIVIGALILPWLTAIFIVSTHGSADDFSSIGAGVPLFLQGVIPASGNLQMGQFVVGFLAWVPMMVIAIATGLTWNWRRFIIAWVIFHALFAFFYTTIFTNIQGLATGMIYSLQYWLEQQGERRGNQPQYYYLLIILPIYEYLPIIGSVLAMVTGFNIFWRRRNLLDQAQQTTREFVLMETSGDSAVSAGAVETPDNPEAQREQAQAIEAVEAAEPASLGGLLMESEKPKRGILASDPLPTEQARRIIPTYRQLTEPSFLMFVGWWAIFIIIALTLAGEKMPWLGTHMTTPMIFLTAWYFGSIFDKVEWRKVLDRGWMYLLIFPFLFVLLFQLIAQPLGGRVPFAGTSLEQIQATNSWVAAALFTAAAAFALYRLGQYTGWRHLRQMFAVSMFLVLSLMTLRTAWMASFINYDLATEYLVYAHATPGTKIVASALEDISLRTTNGYDLKFAYDDKMSWPGVWYFRKFDKEVYMGKNPTLQQMEGAAVVLVGEANRSVVEPLLEDRYQRFEYSRMWWPMMDYFNLTAQRIVDTFRVSASDGIDDATNKATVDKSAQIRRGLFDIWWNRDYTAYGKALNKDFSLPNWPVQEKMYMYVRKDIAAQVWQYGTGDTSVANSVTNEQVSACVANWIQPSASLVFNTAAAGLRAPIGVAVAPDGTLYVADAADETSRLVKFNSQTGELIGTFGQAGESSQAGAFFKRPNGVRVGPDGTIYVVDTWNYQVRTFTANGEPIKMWGQPLTIGFDAQQPVDGFWGPRDIDIDSAGNVYVADTGNKRIRVYTADGQWLRDLGSGGSAPGQLDEPSGIAIAKDGRIFVADTWNRRISVFNADGSFSGVYSLKAWYDVLGSRPYLAIDPNRPLLYVTDPEGGRVLVLNLNGDCVGAFGRPNRDNPNASEFSTLGGITVDQQGYIYVVDSGTNRVLRFDPFPVTDAQVNGDSSGDNQSVDVPVQPESSQEVVATEEAGVTDEVNATEEPLTTQEASGAGVLLEKTVETKP